MGKTINLRHLIAKEQAADLLQYTSLSSCKRISVIGQIARAFVTRQDVDRLPISTLPVFQARSLSHTASVAETNMPSDWERYR